MLNTSWCFDKGYFQGLLSGLHHRVLWATLPLHNFDFNHIRKLSEKGAQIQTGKIKPREHSGGIIDSPPDVEIHWDFPGRAGAGNLASSLREVMDGFVTWLRSALKDVKLNLWNKWLQKDCQKNMYIMVLYCALRCWETNDNLVPNLVINVPIGFSITVSWASIPPADLQVFHVPG